MTAFTEGRVFCVSGASGAGKSSVCAALLQRHPDLLYSVSLTTRSPREGEISGKDYVFVSDQKFDEIRDTNGFVEWVHVYGHRSGTPRGPIEVAISRGEDILIEVEAQGACFVFENFPRARIVFLLPPSPDAQRERLLLRGTTGQDLENRLQASAAEREQVASFAVEVVNKVFDTTVRDVEAILYSTASAM